MQLNTLLRTAQLVGILALSLVSVEGALTINWGAAELLTSDGISKVPTGGLVILVADTSGDGFLPPTPGAFCGADDIEVARVAVGTGGYPAGQFLVSLTSLNLGDKGNGNTWKVADLLQMYWYPDLTTGAIAPGAGTSYGAFRADTDLYVPGALPPVEYSDAWSTPGDGGTISLQFLNESLGGASPDTFGIANLNVVPEPVNFALSVFAGIVLVVVGFRCTASTRPLN